MVYVPPKPLQPSEPRQEPSGRRITTGSRRRDSCSDLNSVIRIGRHVPDTDSTVGCWAMVGVGEVDVPPATGAGVGLPFEPIRPKPATAMAATATAAAPETIQ